ncbi:hypothetical protein BT96DRAFT_836150, partial [Gymnopus androsaceus JB14]
NAIVCLDTVFMQKNNKHVTEDPSHVHLKTVFIPELGTSTICGLPVPVPTGIHSLQVHTCTCGKPSAKESTDGDEQVDGCGGPLKVPNLVLGACKQSFTAADGSHQKASSQFFDSTALMGLLC